MQWMFSGLIQVLSVQESSLRVVQICVTFEIRAEMCARLRENVIELIWVPFLCFWIWLCNHMIVYVAVLDVWISDTIRVFYFPILFLNFICIFLGFFSPQCIREMNFQLNPIQLLNYKVMDHLVETKTKISNILHDFCIDDQTPDFVKDQSNVRTQTTTN